MGKSPISMVIFNSYVSHNQRVICCQLIADRPSGSWRTEKSGNGLATTPPREPIAPGLLPREGPGWQVAKGNFSRYQPLSTSKDIKRCGLSMLFISFHMQINLKSWASWSLSCALQDSSHYKWGLRNKTSHPTIDRYPDGGYSEPEKLQPDNQW